MADLMGKDTVELLLRQGLEQCRGYHQISQFGDDAHDACSQHLPFEKRPEEDIGIKTLGLAEPDESLSQWPRRQGCTAPEKAD